MKRFLGKEIGMWWNNEVRRTDMASLDTQAPAVLQ